MTEECPYTSRLQKGGALVEDMRALVRHWSEGDFEELRDRVIAENILGKNTRARSADTIRRSFAPRFLHGDPPNAWRLVRPLEDRSLSLETIRPIYYWITARNDALLCKFVSEELFARSRGVDKTIRIEETTAWITLALAEYAQEWTPTVTTKVARGMLAALRDFAVLKGRARKEIAPVYLPSEAFAFLAFTLKGLGYSGQALVAHDDWRLFLMSQPMVEHAFLDAHQRGYVSYASAGNVYRIEFPAQTTEEMADVIA